MPEALLANLVVTLACFVQATAGMGYAMIAVPMLALVDPGLLPGPSLMVSLLLAATMVSGDRRAIVRRELSYLLPALAIGTAVGAVVLVSLPGALFGLVVGLIVLAAVVISVLTPQVALNAASLSTAGFAAGLLGTVSGIHGPPMAVVYQREPLPKIRATMALAFLIGYSLSLAGLAVAGRLGTIELHAAATLLPGLLLGLGCAFACRGLFDARSVRTALLVLASASALVLTIKSLAALTR